MKDIYVHAWGWGEKGGRSQHVAIYRFYIYTPREIDGAHAVKINEGNGGQN